jgi:hypothetical protein
MQKTLILALTLVAVLAVGVYAIVSYNKPAENPPPAIEEPTSPIPEAETVTVEIGKTVRTLAETDITPLAVIEDSRCPQDVQCVWAGRVRLSVRLDGGMGPSVMEMEIGKMVSTEAVLITLVDVSPAPRAEKPLDPLQYRFTFEVAPRSE